MEEVVLNNSKSNDNPFRGLKHCYNLFSNSDHALRDDCLLDLAWKEVKFSKEKKEMFFSLLFSIGDVSNRQHNIFKGVKRDNGGNSNRTAFQTIIKWLFEKQTDQFVKFLHAGLFNEYTCFDSLLVNRVKSKGPTVLGKTTMFETEKYRKIMAEYLYKVINGTNAYDKFLVSKFLTLPRVSKRSGHKRMLDITRQVMEYKVDFLVELSKMMNWSYETQREGEHYIYANFTGYRKWRQQFNTELESVLFSTGKIKSFDEAKFLEWFGQLPAQARFRVKNRILYSKDKDDKPKYAQFQEWLNNWTTNKEEKQKEQRVLEEKVRQGQADENDIKKLNAVKKEAKVTIGATNLSQIYEDIKKGKFDELRIQSFIDTVNLPYNSLTIIDDSGSMSGLPFELACFIATACLYKNPDDDARNLVGFFNSTSHWHTCINSKGKRRNAILNADIEKVKAESFINPLKSFYENYMSFREFAMSVFNGGCTYITSIPEYLNDLCKRQPEILDSLKNYPVWTIISDGEFNNMPSPKSSLEVFMANCQKYFGYKPFIVAIDVQKGWGWNESSIPKFEDIENVIYIPANINQIEQFLTNFKDMETFDVYTPLQSLYRSNRYDLVRQNVI